MFCWYVRQAYLQNDLRVPGQDDAVRRARRPHRRSTFRPTSTRRAKTTSCRGRRRTNRRDPRRRAHFVLGASGHIAGVINPPAKNKRNYWTGGPAMSEPDTWLEGAQKIPGSWWPDWAAWLAPHGGKRVAAPNAPGGKRYRVIEPAPGRYVKERCGSLTPWDEGACSFCRGCSSRSSSRFTSCCPRSRSGSRRTSRCSKGLHLFDAARGLPAHLDVLDQDLRGVVRHGRGVAAS